MPLGEGYTIEGQITEKEDVGGIQIQGLIDSYEFILSVSSEAVECTI